MSEEVEKPQCGGGALGDQDYDLPLHVAAVFIVLAASAFGAGFPVVAKKVRWMKIPPKVFFFCKHFGTGVLIATAFVHLVPTAFFALSNPCLPDLFTTNYPPIAGVIMMGSLFALFVIEMWLNSKTGGHSHGGATGQNIIPSQSHGAGGIHGISAPYAVYPPPNPPSFSRADSYSSEHTLNGDERYYANEKQYPSTKEYSVDEKSRGSEMPAWFVVFYEQYVRQRDEMITAINRNIPTVVSNQVEQGKSYFESDPEHGEVDPLVLRKMSLNITLLEGGILFHSIFVGMTISITAGPEFIVLLVAILFHQMFEGLGLGSRIAAVPYPKGSWRPWILVIAFGTTCPIGQAIGLATRNTYDPDSAFGLIIVGVFNAISSGLLIYAALVDLMAEDFLSEEANETMNKKEKTLAFVYLLLGALGMSIVGAFA